MTKTSDVKKVVLAYSGGLDTSVILRWLQETYSCEVVTFTADLGQGEELEPARAKAEALGAAEIHVEDLRETFVADYVWPMLRANAAYEGLYLLGSAIARPLIAKRQIEIAESTGADAVAHGATGKGNDQVRFELGYYALKPDIRVIAPWREWDLDSRAQLLAYAEAHQIPIARDATGEAPYSGRCQFAARLLRGQGARGPLGRARRERLSAHGRARGRTRYARVRRDRFRGRRCGRDRWRAPLAGDVARAPQYARRGARRGPARSRREPLRRHEVARHLRDPRRHHPEPSPTAPSRA